MSKERKRFRVDYRLAGPHDWQVYWDQLATSAHEAVSLTLDGMPDWIREKHKRNGTTFRAVAEEGKLFGL